MQENVQSSNHVHQHSSEHFRVSVRLSRVRKQTSIAMLWGHGVGAVFLCSNSQKYVKPRLRTQSEDLLHLVFSREVLAAAAALY